MTVFIDQHLASHRLSGFDCDVDSDLYFDFAL